MNGFAKKYIAYAHKDHTGMCAFGLSDDEMVRRSDAFVFYGMRLPSSCQEAQDWLSEDCGVNFGKKSVWRVEPYDEVVSPNSLNVLSECVFAWEEPQCKSAPKSGYKVKAVIGVWADGHSTDADAMLFAPDDSMDGVTHDLVVALGVEPHELNNGVFTWVPVDLSLPVSVVDGIRKVAEADILRSLGRHLNDIYLSESPAETDRVDEKREKALRCDGLKIALDVIKERIEKM